MNLTCTFQKRTTHNTQQNNTELSLILFNGMQANTQEVISHGAESPTQTENTDHRVTEYPHSFTQLEPLYHYRVIMGQLKVIEEWLHVIYIQCIFCQYYNYTRCVKVKKA